MQAGAIEKFMPGMDRIMIRAALDNSRSVPHLQQGPDFDRMAT
jgi:hypothetical protein